MTPPVRILAAAFAVLALAAGCSKDSAADSTADGTTAEATDAAAAAAAEPTTTTALVPVGEPVNRFSLQVGDCFNAYNAVSLITRVSCDEPHDREVFHAERHPAPHGEPYPGERAMQNYATGVCYQQFQAFTGGLYELSKLEIGAFIPTQQNFEDARARYRGITCWLYAKGGQTTGSLRGRAE